MAETIELLKAEVAGLKAKLDSQAAWHAIDLAVLKESPTSADALDEAWREGFRRGVAERAS